MAGYLPDSKTLAATGGAGLLGMSFEQSFAMAGMIVLTGGALYAASKVAPRVAYEPRYDLQKGKQRMMLTVNGNPIRRRQRL